MRSLPDGASPVPDAIEGNDVTKAGSKTTSTPERNKEQFGSSIKRFGVGAQTDCRVTLATDALSAAVCPSRVDTAKGDCPRFPKESHQ